MRMLHAAILAALAAPFALATTLVAVWTPNQLLLAADSSVTSTAPGMVTHGCACKIGQSGSTFFALSGLVHDASSGLHAQQLVQDAAAQGGTVEQQLQRFLDSASGPLGRSLAQVRRDSPDQFEFLRQGHPALEAIFATVEHGSPSLAIAGFRLSPDGTPTPFAHVIARGDDGRGPRIIYAGRQEHIREYLRAHRDWSQSDPAQLAETLVSLEIPNSDGQVGGPVDIVRVAPDAATWVQRKAQCTD